MPIGCIIFTSKWLFVILYYIFCRIAIDKPHIFQDRESERLVTFMEAEFQNAYGKGIGEVMRDIAEFLSTPVIIHTKKQIDLCTLLDDLNMHEQFSFALLCEAEAQGWETNAAEVFYRQAVAGIIAPKTMETILLAFRNRDGETFRSLEARYGNRFTALDGSYWATALALGIDAGEVDKIMYYLRSFTVTLMEFAYMEDRNPAATYTWCYYNSFRGMLDTLLAEPDTEPFPLKVRSLGGTIGKREGDIYVLSIGLDIENPNAERMARGVSIDVTLKDRSGRVITVIADKIQSLDPSTIYHYGITRRIRGAAVASFSAVAKADSYLKLKSPIMKHFSLSNMRLKKNESGMYFRATVIGKYDHSLQAPTLHYQFLSTDNKILGGGSVWIARGLEPNTSQSIESALALPIENVSKVICSLDFDALDLVRD